MKILIYSPKFFPSIGGLENLTLMLTREWKKSGHEVKVITFEESNGIDCGVETYYKPSRLVQLKMYYWCEVFYMPNVSLKALWLFRLFKRKVVISHNGWYERSNGVIAWQDRMKLNISKQYSGIAVSKAVADRLPHKPLVIPNCYDNNIFKCSDYNTRQEDLLFVGRLVSSKGLELLLESYILLLNRGHKFSLTIIGSGPEQEWLESYIEQNTLELVRYIGPKQGVELCGIMNGHKILVVPSIRVEAFGITVLEGLASGCKVVCSKVGGLPEAAAHFGFYFNDEDIHGCADAIERAIVSNYNESSLRNHLDNHTTEIVAKKYLQVFNN